MIQIANEEIEIAITETKESYRPLVIEIQRLKKERDDISNFAVGGMVGSFLLGIILTVVTSVII